MLFAVTQVNFVGQWNTVWGAVNSALGPVSNLMSIAGTILVVFAAGKWLWERRKGGANHSHLLWTLGVGALLLAPNIIVPVVLTILDAVINAVVGIGTSSGA
jgi:hypothetical protein